MRTYSHTYTIIPLLKGYRGCGKKILIFNLTIVFYDFIRTIETQMVHRLQYLRYSIVYPPCFESFMSTMTQGSMLCVNSHMYGAGNLHITMRPVLISYNTLWFKTLVLDIVCYLG